MVNGNEISDRQSLEPNKKDIASDALHPGSAVEPKIAVGRIGGDQEREIPGKRPVGLDQRTTTIKQEEEEEWS